MSAAARVLALPELLEFIMLEIAAQADLDSDNSLEPITSLLPLHLVDHTFNDVLKNSPRLQRLMFSQSAPFLLTPMEWIQTELERSSLPNITINRHTRSTDLTIDTRPKQLSCYDTKSMELLASKLANPAASWRRIQVFQSEIESERLSTAIVHYSNGSSRIKFDFEDGTTLGDIFDRIVGIGQRTPAQHVAAANATYESNYRRQDSIRWLSPLWSPQMRQAALRAHSRGRI
ncbi:uncharacterized protein RCC_07741 [Ramularia collo-cygni]|uniref:F-box domain-containing protein n=1 Tax=Ramularia collo-cygni TaxID=112498 RepID=A0A2D3V5A5_9PEZI|nr:uncharacterized protein RCC_07741 [Ramularia collo-cygni]CZT21875.1 uncharacterized protein RCC_07741 [Ramularia collo-cygni]